MKGLEICLLHNNSRFAMNSCPYSDIAISHLDKIINETRSTQFQECFYFGRYGDDSLVLLCGDTEKLNDFHQMLNNLDKKLKFTMEFGGNSI